MACHSTITDQDLILAHICCSLHYQVWYGMVWYGMVWYGMIWYDMIWYGMVWYNMEGAHGCPWWGIFSSSEFGSAGFPLENSCRNFEELRRIPSGPFGYLPGGAWLQEFQISQGGFTFI